MVTVGNESLSVATDFSNDSICKIPKVFDFKSEGDKNGQIAVAFDFV